VIQKTWFLGFVLIGYMELRNNGDGSFVGSIRRERYMSNADTRRLKLAIAVTIMIILLLIYLPNPAFSQEGAPPTVQNLIVNGGFEGGFQPEYGIGYGWGGFSNGNAVVGWRFDSWAPVVADGKYSQSIEIKDALSSDRYAGIYQTLSVVPGQQYKLSLKGLIRSDEGDIKLSNYGYRLQYTVDYEGGTAWELVDVDAWVELPWDEQPLADPEAQSYQFKTYETTITAQGDKLTLFIRGWKKWINNGAALFNLDEISFVGPAPEGFQAPVAQAASVGNMDEPTTDAPAADRQTESNEDAVVSQAEAPQTNSANASPQTQTLASLSAQANRATQSDQGAQSEVSTQAAPVDQSEDAAPEETAELPVSGLGQADSSHYVTVIGIAILLLLLAGAIKATIQQSGLAE
jgi:hypothetical protein